MGIGPQNVGSLSLPSLIVVGLVAWCKLLLASLHNEGLSLLGGIWSVGYSGSMYQMYQLGGA